MGNRQYRQGNDENELWRVRDEVMKQVNVFAEAETPMELKAGSVKTAEYTIHQTYDLDAMKAQLAEDEKKLAAAVTEDDKKLLWSGVRHMRRKIQSGGINVTLRSVIFHLGDLEMITIPGELFSTFGMEIKKNFNAPMRIVWGYANYSAGYIVEKDESEKAMKACRLLSSREKQELYVDHLIKSL